MDAFVWFWLILGAVLLVAEFVVPGMVLVFLGMGAWAVAALVSGGIVDDTLPAFSAWFGISLVFVVTLRRFAQRLFPAETSMKQVDEDREYEDTLVDVVTAITADNSDGRVRMQGTTWAARALDEPIAAGGRAKLLYRENLVWIVSPVSLLEKPE